MESYVCGAGGGLGDGAWDVMCEDYRSGGGGDRFGGGEGGCARGGRKVGVSVEGAVGAEGGGGGAV